VRVPHHDAFCSDRTLPRRPEHHLAAAAVLLWPQRAQQLHSVVALAGDRVADRTHAVDD
jgi:hypothetical protein